MPLATFPLSNFSAKGTVILLLLSSSLCLLSGAAAAQTETVLYSFSSGSDGGAPVAAVILDPQGNLYGTTESGGGGGNFGTVFEINSAGAESVLHAFVTRFQGNGPVAGLIRDRQGNLYGTTFGGGPADQGTVFKVTPTGATKALYRFSGPDGANPSGTLVADTQGNLYGTTTHGGNGQMCGNGSGGCGTVFELTPAGVETVLYNFSGGDDGSEPTAGLVRDTQGNLYGTTTGIGFGKGNVFELSAAGVETSLYSFTGGPDGATPTAGLIRDQAGNLYGAAAQGGFFGGDCHAVGCGTVFQLTPAGHFRVLHAFAGGTDGEIPNGLVRDSFGNLYGTTRAGGSVGDGTVFSVTAADVETVLYDFSAPGDGLGPQAGLVLDAQHNLYGTTVGGGAFGHGTVFQLAP